MILGIDTVTRVYAEAITKNAPELETLAADFSRDTSLEKFYRLKHALERIERDIAVRDALRNQMGVFS